jgi:iron(III) transport system substrate-binding protein
VKLEYWRGDVSQMMQKILAERRADRPVGDLAEGGNVAMHLNKANMAQVFVTPESKPYGKDYVDPAGTWVTTRLGYYGTAYNTKLVKESEAPKTYDDLLDPKWKGKMAWRSGAESGNLTFIMNILLDRGEKATEDYFAKLAKNEIVNYTQSANALVDRVGQGEYPLALNAAAHHPIMAQAQGAPLDVIMMDPIAINTMPLALIKDAPHPHAAMLLIDFLISREGQEMLRDVNYFSALPGVEPIPEMRKITPQARNMRANVVPPESFVAKRDWLLEIEMKYFQ